MQIKFRLLFLLILLSKLSVSQDLLNQKLILKGDTIKINQIKFKKGIFVIYSANCCTGCKIELNNFLCSTKDSNTKYYSIIRAKFSISNYWTNLSELNYYCDIYDELYYDYTTSNNLEGILLNNDGVLKELKIQRTPCLVFINLIEGKFEFIPYHKLFNGIYLTSESKMKILGFLKD
ncbi:MAG: hypothetical protein L6Q78_14635 [Bacteroidia bacterium]|nr:hypothetical protein [Bacteroidia bacterium]